MDNGPLHVNGPIEVDPNDPIITDIRLSFDVGYSRWDVYWE